MKKIYKGLIIGIIALSVIIILITIFILYSNKDSKDSINVAEDQKYYTITLVDAGIGNDKFNEVKMIDDTIYYYSKEEGKYGKIFIENEIPKSEILASGLYDVSDIQISPLKNNLLYLDNKTKIYNIYNLQTEIREKFNKYILSAIWNPFKKEDVVIGSYYDPPYSNINNYDIKSNKREKLFDIPLGSALIKDVSFDSKDTIYVVMVYDENEFLVFEESVYFNIYDFDKNEAVFNVEQAPDGKFNNNGSKILISKIVSENISELLILNAETYEEKKINLDIDFDKIEFTNNSNILVYAQTTKEGLNESVNDVLWKVDITSGEKTQLTELNENIKYDISNIMISSDNKNIYFINKYDKKLYQVVIE